MSSTNGWYAVVAGPLRVSDPEVLRKKLTDLWWPPQDTFTSKGRSFVEKARVAPNSPVLAIASSQEGQRITSAAGIEVRANGDNAIVRNTGQDVANMRFADPGPAISTTAEIV
jgi:hypothetical protein